MTNSQSNLLDQAKQGDPQAIAAIMNRSLHPKGILVKTALQGECLEIFLESLDPPEQITLMAYIRRGIENLGLRSLTTVKVYGSQTGSDTPIWQEEFGLQAGAPDFVSDFELPVRHTVPEPQPRTNPAPEATRSTHAPQNHATDAGEQFQQTMQDAIAAFKLFMINPLGGLPGFYEEVGKQRALRVGAVFSLFYIVCLLFSAFSLNKTFGNYLSVIRFNFTNILFIGIAQVLGFWAATALSRKMFKGYGALAGDIFIVGISSLAPALFLLLSSMIGILNFETILILLTVATSYSTLTLYAGCHRISKIPETLSPLAVAFILVFTGWLSKIVMTSMVQSMLQNGYRGGF
ncbi:hypothetical protein ACN4EK_27255 [Pantanalinema rosaneae CENA516]|uniref:hypothetical protein n=1 Tax=Pantanalinema rosaneae TaxID=1620701 RepID=UPI003D6F7670